MSFGTITSFSKPKRLKPVSEKKRIKQSGRKGEFWAFVSKILTRFFLKIEMERRCEKCDGSAYCGPITPAHSRRRNGIRVNDWWYACRVAVLGSSCHYDIDSLGGPAAEPIIEKIITDRFQKMGLSDADVKRLLLECAAEVQAEDAQTSRPRFQEFLVVFDQCRYALT